MNLKKFLTDNHYKTICEAVRSECSSYRLLFLQGGLRLIYVCFRVTAGYVLSLGTMMFIVLCDVQLRLFSDEMSYRITLAAVGVIALGCTGQYHFQSWVVSVSKQ